MYIRAELSNPDRMLVEMGTGYFAEISREKAAEFFERKKKYITQQVRIRSVHCLMAMIFSIPLTLKHSFVSLFLIPHLEQNRILSLIVLFCQFLFCQSSLKRLR